MTELLVPVDPAAAFARAGSPRTSALSLGIDLTAVGVHHTAWPVASDEPRSEIDLTRVTELVQAAEGGAVDFVAFGDDFTLAPAPTRTTASRLDAARVACRLAPVTSRVGLVATLDTSYLDPVHISTAIATLHTKSQGRAAWQVGAAQARALGHTAEVWDRLGREVRRVVAAWPVGSAAVGPWSGRAERPAVVIRVDSDAAAVAAGTSADVARIEALDAAQARALRAEIRAAAEAAGRDPDAVRVLADVVAIISRDAASARVRRDILSDLSPGEPAWNRTLSHLGSSNQLADLLEAWFSDRVVDGFTVVPGSLPHDVRVFVGDVLPALAERGLIEGLPTAA